MKKLNPKDTKKKKKVSSEEFVKRVNRIMVGIMVVVCIGIAAVIFISFTEWDGGNTLKQGDNTIPPPKETAEQVKDKALEYFNNLKNNEANKDSSPDNAKDSSRNTGDKKASDNSNINQTGELEKEKKVTVDIKTDKGDIKIAVYPELMPETVNNFRSLVSKGFYNGLKFHRVEDGVIQGGDPKGDGTGGSDKTVKLETNPKLKNIYGAVGMARSDDPNSASSQFYILKTDSPMLDGNYAIFGSVVSGMDIVEKIQKDDKMLKVEELK